MILNAMCNAIIIRMEMIITINDNNIILLLILRMIISILDILCLYKASLGQKEQDRISSTQR